MSFLTTARARLARFIAPASLPPASPSELKAHRASPALTFDGPRMPVWSTRDATAFAREGFMQNAIVYRAVRLIAEAAGSVPLLVYDGDTDLDTHPLRALLRHPHAGATTADLIERLLGFLLVSGNAYLEAVGTDDTVRELHVLRTDRIRVVPGPDGWPDAYDYTLDGRATRLAGETIPGVARILHLKLFHPLDDHYGLSPLEAAASAIDLHNTATAWNKALLDNSARPSGALVYTARDGHLTSDQFERLKRELETGFQGSLNAGRPLLLEGGLDWKAMSLTPKDMDFLEARNTAAREIALAIGVPPQLLGIPGDATYANYQEANRAFWRHTVIPLVHRIAAALTGWLATPQSATLSIRPDFDAVDALTADRDALWSRLNAATFLTSNEKRAAAGYVPMDALASPSQEKFNPWHDALGRFTTGPDDAADQDAELVPAAGKRGPPKPTTPPSPTLREYKKPRSQQSGRESADDVPSLFRGERPYVGETGDEFAERLLRKHKPGDVDRGPGSDFSKIKKWGERHFE